MILNIIFHMGIDIAIVFLAAFFLRNMKKPKTVDTKTHYSKGSLHVGAMEALLKHSDAFI